MSKEINHNQTGQSSFRKGFLKQFLTNKKKPKLKDIEEERKNKEIRNNIYTILSPKQELPKGINNIEIKQISKSPAIEIKRKNVFMKKAKEDLKQISNKRLIKLEKAEKEKPIIDRPSHLRKSLKKFSKPKFDVFHPVSEKIFYDPTKIFSNYSLYSHKTEKSALNKSKNKSKSRTIQTERKCPKTSSTQVNKKEKSIKGKEETKDNKDNRVINDYRKKNQSHEKKTTNSLRKTPLYSKNNSTKKLKKIENTTTLSLKEMCNMTTERPNNQIKTIIVNLIRNNVSRASEMPSKSKSKGEFVSDYHLEGKEGKGNNVRRPKHNELVREDTDLKNFGELQMLELSDNESGIIINNNIVSINTNTFRGIIGGKKTEIDNACNNETEYISRFLASEREDLLSQSQGFKDFQFKGTSCGKASFRKNKYKALLQEFSLD